MRGLLTASLPRGRYDVFWDGTDGTGVAVPPGVYFVHVRTDAGVVTQRLVRMD